MPIRSSVPIRAENPTLPRIFVSSAVKSTSRWICGRGITSSCSSTGIPVQTAPCSSPYNWAASAGSACPPKITDTASGSIRTPRRVRRSALFSGGHIAFHASRMSLSVGFGNAFFGFSCSCVCFFCTSSGFFSSFGGFFFSGSTWNFKKPNRALTVSSSPNRINTPTRVRHSSRTINNRMPKIHHPITAAAPSPSFYTSAGSPASVCAGASVSPMGSTTSPASFSRICPSSPISSGSSGRSFRLDRWNALRNCLVVRY